MAKTTKSAKSDRQKVIDDIRRKQRSAEKRQGRVIVGVCIVVAALIVGAAAYNPLRSWWEKRSYSGKPLDEIGAPAAAACGEITTKKAEGTQDHREEGTPIEYEDAPPAFGPHWANPETIDDRFYTADDRPAIEALVHNLEHGFTILWYDETAADDATMRGEIQAIADRLDDNDTNNRLSFKAVPWTSEDGKDFPDGQHIALTHWSAGDGQTSVGVWQYCSEPSGEALQDFMKKYPYTDAPEPIGGYTG